MAQDQELTGFADQAQQGDAEAICTLGFRYLYGEDGLKQNDTLAFQHFKESAELGDPRAMFNLGRCYEQGCGCEVDYEQADEWYSIAARRGVILAAERLLPSWSEALSISMPLPKTGDRFLQQLDQGLPFFSRQRVQELLHIGAAVAIDRLGELSPFITKIQPYRAFVMLPRLAIQQRTLLQTVERCARGSLGDAAAVREFRHTGAFVLRNPAQHRSLRRSHLNALGRRVGEL